MLAVFASSAAIIWFAYGESGELSAVDEPILVRASSTPLKVAPDDPGGSTVAELGGIGDHDLDRTDQRQASWRGASMRSGITVKNTPNYGF